MYTYVFSYLSLGPNNWPKTMSVFGRKITGQIYHEIVLLSFASNHSPVLNVGLSYITISYYVMTKFDRCSSIS